MNPDQLYQSRNEDWKKFSELLEKVRRDITRLSPEEVDQLGNLYREISSDLSLAQRDFPRHKITKYLNQLVARGHAVIYQQEPFSLGKIVNFIIHTLPQVYRNSISYTLIAAALFLIPALASGLVIRFQPAMSKWVLPAGITEEITPMIENQELWTDIPINERPFTSSFIMQNNIRVAFLAFGSGVLAGVITGWILISNGLILGGLTGLTAYYGMGLDLWNFVIGHGVIEFSVIIITGGSGLMLGWAVLHPGLLRRRDSLSLAAQSAIKLLIGLVPFLILAGLIEGFISPNENIPSYAKWVIGISSGLLMQAYLILSGRNREK